MSINTTTREANVSEIAAEMDRRGCVIEQLEARLAHIDGIYRGAIDNLQHHQRQLDQDGIEVAVSRQALWEVLAGVEAALAQPASQEGWREIETNFQLKGCRVSPAYFPATGEVCDVSGPNCDDAEGYTWMKFTILWQNEKFVLYGNDGYWPNLHKREHILCRPLPAAPTKGA